MSRYTRSKWNGLPMMVCAECGRSYVGERAKELVIEHCERAHATATPAAQPEEPREDIYGQPVAGEE